MLYFTTFYFHNLAFYLTFLKWRRLIVRLSAAWIMIKGNLGTFNFFFSLPKNWFRYYMFTTLKQLWMVRGGIVTRMSQVWIYRALVSLLQKLELKWKKSIIGLVSFTGMRQKKTPQNLFWNPSKQTGKLENITKDQSIIKEYPPTFCSLQREFWKHEFGSTKQANRWITVYVL